MSLPLDAWAEAALGLADLARPLALEHFRAAPAVEIKGDATPVTAADRAIEAALRGAIAQRFPDHGILGEEEGATGADREVVWVLDPIDGTKAFATGKPLFVTLIAVAHRGHPVVGVIEAPATGERWLGVRGRPTQFQGEPCRVRPARRLDDAVLYTTSPDMWADDPGALDRLRERVRWTCWNADGYAYGLLAAGHVDLVVERAMQPHDFCALVPVVAGAGGVITDHAGRPLRIDSDGTVLATTGPDLAAAVRTVLAGTPE